MTYKRAFSPIKTLVFSIVAGCLFAACQEDEFESIARETESNIAEVKPLSASNVGSITIIGENTQIAGTVDCKTCTFVLDNKSETVDGAELGAKPGSIICLETGVTYGNLTFINLQGTESDPIIIAHTTRR